jgi:hypothetical protein
MDRSLRKAEQVANPTNSVDLHDKDFETTHAALITTKQDEQGRESTPAGSQTDANEDWGNWVDDVVLALRAQGEVWNRLTDATSNATPSSQAIRACPDAGVLDLELKAWGKVGAQDFCFRNIRRRYERDAASIIEDTDYDSGILYSSGGTLSTATVILKIVGTGVQVEVTGEAATTISWELYYRFLEAYA